MRLRAAILAFTAIAVLVAGAILPACATGCCAFGETESMHAEMPCCETPSFTPRDASRQPVNTTAKIAPQAHVATAVIAPRESVVAPVRAAAPADSSSDAHHDPSPPLFLLNAQFLI